MTDKVNQAIYIYDSEKDKVKTIQLKTFLCRVNNILRNGSIDIEGCRTWEQGGKKYICFWDVVINRYTTAIDPMITYKKARN